MLTSATAHMLLAQAQMVVHRSDGSVLHVPIDAVDSVTYSNGTVGNMPSVSIDIVFNITDNRASVNATSQTASGPAISERGICWSTHPYPTLSDATDGAGSGEFPSTYYTEADSLLPGTTYHVRPFLRMGQAVLYGPSQSFETVPFPGLFWPGSGMLDQDGNEYPTVIYFNGDEWMASNLRATTFRNGEPIPTNLSQTEWSSSATPAYVAQPNAIEDSIYGNFYNYRAAIDTRKVCPSGWHLPTNAEWNLLSTYLGGDSLAGGRMKSTGTLDDQTGHWAQPNNAATNTAGFNGQGRGNVSPNLAVQFPGQSAYFWCNGPIVGGLVRTRALVNWHGHFGFDETTSLGWGVHIRCKKD